MSAVFSGYERQHRWAWCQWCHQWSKAFHHWLTDGSRLDTVVSRTSAVVTIVMWQVYMQAVRAIEWAQSICWPDGIGAFKACFTLLRFSFFHMLIVMCNWCLRLCLVTWLQLKLCSSASQAVGWKELFLCQPVIGSLEDCLQNGL